MPISFLALYKDGLCATTPYVPLEASPVPMFRLLQAPSRDAKTAYYPGNPTEVTTFANLSPLGQPDACQPTLGTGWDALIRAGPVVTFDLSMFTKPFVIK